MAARICGRMSVAQLLMIGLAVAGVSLVLPSGWQSSASSGPIGVAGVPPAHGPGAVQGAQTLATPYVAPKTLPGPRTDAALAWDERDGYVVMYGGYSPSHGALSDTWTYSGGVWTEICSVCAPGPLYDAAMTYDYGDHYLFLFGGTTGTSYSNAGWSFVGGSWTALAMTGTVPSPRSAASIAYDAEPQGAGYVLLYAGTNGPALGDTFHYHAGVWTTECSPCAPGFRYFAGMSNDSTIPEVVLYGGISSAGAVLSDTWIHTSARGGSWVRQVCNYCAPGPLAAHGIANDRVDGMVVMFGGNSVNPGSTFSQSTWGFVGTWVRIAVPESPDYRAYVGFTNDTPDGYMVLYAGDGQNAGRTSGVLQDTWTYVSGAWTNHFPGPRYGEAVGDISGTSGSFAYNVVLFGGCCDSYGKPYSDTWGYAAGFWQELWPSTSPVAQYDMGYTVGSPVSGTGLIIVDGTGTSGYLSEVWEFSAGGWSSIWNGVGGPSPRALPAITFDQASGQIVLFGGQGYPSRCTPGTGACADTWLFGGPLGSNWANQIVTGPSARWGAFMVDYGSAPHSEALLYGGTDSTTVFGDAWYYTVGTGWRLVCSGGKCGASTLWGTSAGAASTTGPVYMFGGDLSTGAVSSNSVYQWSFSTNNWVLQTTGPISSRYLAGSYWDPGDGYLLVFGGVDNGGNQLGDAWGYAGGITWY